MSPLVVGRRIQHRYGDEIEGCGLFVSGSTIAQDQVASIRRKCNLSISIGEAVHPMGQERPIRRPVERKRRRQQRDLVQKRPHLPDQLRLWRLDQPPRARLARGGLGGPTLSDAASAVGVERPKFSVPGESLEVFLIYGPMPKEALSRYTALTGRPALPPPGSFGLWLTPRTRQALVHHRVRRGHGDPLCGRHGRKGRIAVARVRRGESTGASSPHSREGTSGSRAVSRSGTSTVTVFHTSSRSTMS